MMEEIYDTYYVYSLNNQLLFVSPLLENVKEFVKKETKREPAISILNNKKMTINGLLVTGKLVK
jgi:hypothetical protein